MFCLEKGAWLNDAAEERILVDRNMLQIIFQPAKYLQNNDKS